MNKNLHDGHRERVRERFIREGLQGFQDHQILELLLFYCVPMRDTNELAHKMINKFGSFHNLVDATPKEICDRCGVTMKTAVLISMIPHLANRYSLSKWDPGLIMDNSEIAGEYAVSLYTGLKVETVYLFCLDAQRRLRHAALIIKGTLDEAPIYPRELARAALAHDAIYVILVHNHPGGTLEASNSDKLATKKIMDVFQMFKIEVIDHIIVCGDKYLSFAKKRLMGLGY